ncbi:9997_t:CDS:2 [Racocetra fulgida]|uniref:9997_t:CDS:1 n=1 Tax=Racocetra fulgida TaxID=60492 RepID=A0A9N8ZSX8_9GLOM|nr:9997_t:CDS:2 [Racocetra fulgida]
MILLKTIPVIRSTNQPIKLQDTWTRKIKRNKQSPKWNDYNYNTKRRRQLRLNENANKDVNYNTNYNTNYGTNDGTNDYTNYNTKDQKQRHK